MITTDRLLLRRWRDEDADAHYAMCQDAEVMRFLGPPVTRTQSAEVVDRQNAFLESFGACFWAVERLDTPGVFIGWCGVKPGPAGTPIADEPELGWSLARPYWGRGYAAEAARASVAWAWDRLDAREVAAITVPANTRSRAVMERLGLSRVVDGDFDHPALEPDDPLRRHVQYRLARPA